jgi:hypothetical protein
MMNNPQVGETTIDKAIGLLEEAIELLQIIETEEATASSNAPRPLSKIITNNHERIHVPHRQLRFGQRR